ncbi:MAG: DUF2783 domain-containing protein [Burkholderiales bacterium]|nr:DUF2783 domain-containing protein [Burkholderiales bacterium]
MKTTLNFTDHDAFYERLIAAHQGLTDAQSAALNARLVLLLANQVGDDAILAACIDAARRPFDAAGARG